MKKPKKKKLKVFHGLVNYGGQAGILAKGLRKKGIEAISVSGFDPYEREIDVVLKHGGNFVQKIYRHSWNAIFLLKCFFKYNVFHFYYGTSLTKGHWDLPFYRLFGKKLVCHYLGNDVQLYKQSVEKYRITNMTEFISPIEAEKYDHLIHKRLCKETKYANYQLVCAPYLSEFVPNAQILPLAVDLEEFILVPKSQANQIIIMHAPSNRNTKGTKYVIDSIDRLKSEGFSINLLLAENLEHSELKERYKECDIFIDQLLAGWYGMASIEAMAYGKPVMCFIRKEYLDRFQLKADFPIHNVEGITLTEALSNSLTSKKSFLGIGVTSRKFVEMHHNLPKILNELISIYNTVN